ncbi:MAG TPA: ferrous iron transporter B [Thermoanaerobaculia bacterium]|nr:ferrous iron transporter B [Thermoanaerobaculia bacterium]
MNATAPSALPEGAKLLPFPGAQPAAETVLLVGNPNVGKSLLFKNLTRRYVNVSNFPGTTVEITRARAAFAGREIDVVDSPGINDLTLRGDDARVTLQLLEANPGATVVQVADAKNLRRALLLTLQLAEMGRPMVLVLNMLDELAERGGRIDQARLSELLGVPVVGTVAVTNQGTPELVAALKAARPVALPEEEAAEDQDPYERNRGRLARINEIVAETYTLTQPLHAPLSVRLGFWAMHPVKGLFFLAAVLGLVFWFVGLFGAGTLVDLLETGIFEQRITPLAIRAADAVLPFPHTHATTESAATFALPVTPVHEVPLGVLERTVLSPAYSLAPGTKLGTGAAVRRFFHDFLVGEYGAVTMALSYAFAIVLPIVTTFFLLFSLLEDSGYLPRMAILVNRTFRLMGLNGKAVLPMILGLGCDTMATMTTRILETRKERVVTTMLLALAVPCSAQLGVLLAMMASLSPLAALAWTGMMIGIVFLVGGLTARVFPGKAGDFILEIPPMRRPQLANIWRKTLGRLNWYLREVIPLFLVGTAALFLLDRLRALPAIARLGEPLVTGWLGLPKEMSNAFLIGFLRRDFGAVYILDAATGPNPLLTPLQIFVSMVTITLFMPCIANFLMIGKEHGMKVAWAMAAFIFPFAFFVGGVVHHLTSWLSTF